MVNRGIYSSEIEPCGCVIKRYFGGKVIRCGCNTHRVAIYYVCPSCNKKHAYKKDMKSCVWSHAQ